ncbi:MAG: hypothetical protein JNM44_02455 [Chitinophagaceae bacterium]|nr:hypothetical protein [Chitinophagaceae bacterium]
MAKPTNKPTQKKPRLKKSEANLALNGSMLDVLKASLVGVSKKKLTKEK